MQWLSHKSLCFKRCMPPSSIPSIPQRKPFDPSTVSIWPYNRPRVMVYIIVIYLITPPTFAMHQTERLSPMSAISHKPSSSSYTPLKRRKSTHRRERRKVMRNTKKKRKKTLSMCKIINDRPHYIMKRSATASTIFNQHERKI